MMRVIYILSSTMPYGGATKSFLTMVTQLQHAGVVPLVVVPDNGGVCNRLSELGIEYRVLSYRLGVYPPTGSLKDLLLFIPRLLGRIYINRIAAGKICDIAQQFKPNLIHTNVGVLTVGYMAARRLHIPHVWHIREYADLDFDLHIYPSRRNHLRALQQPNSYSVCITHDIAKYNGVDDHKQSQVIYNGIVSGNELHKALPAMTKECFFLFAGRIEQGKGIQQMIDAYIQSVPVMRVKHKLLIAGKIENAEYYAQILDSIAKTQAGEDIVFLGEVANVETYMQQAKAVIIPSVSEGFGRVMPEAMCINTPVIARNTAGSKEQLDNGLQLTGAEIGLRYSTTDELSRLIVQVADAEAEAFAEMTARARQTVCTLYTNEQYAQNILSFYNRILAQ